jgi:hypothetical protein
VPQESQAADARVIVRLGTDHYPADARIPHKPLGCAHRQQSVGWVFCGDACCPMAARPLSPAARPRRQGKVLTGKLSRGRVNSITGAVGVAAGLGDALTGPPVVTLSTVRG